MGKKVCAIVVTYNRLNLLKKNLKCLITQKYKLHDILIINNDSSDGTTQYLNVVKEEYPYITVYNMNRNLGGAGGFSFGVKMGYENTHSEYFWLMDDDTMPTKMSLKYLMDAGYKLNDSFGFLCSNVRWWKNKQPCNIPTVSQKISWSTFAAYNLIGVQECTFVSFLVPREIITKVGLPIAKAVIWGDDTEYSSRIAKIMPSYFVSNSIVIHDAKSVDLSCENIFLEHNKNRISRYKYMYRNRLYVERKYRSFKSFVKWLCIFLIIFIEIPFKSKNRRLKRMYFTMNGIITGLFFNPSIKFPNNRL